MYTTDNFPTKVSVKQAIAEGEEITVYQPNEHAGSLSVPTNGRVSVEGPHFPESHKWWGRGKMKDGFLVELI